MRPRRRAERGGQNEGGPRQPPEPCPPRAWENKRGFAPIVQGQDAGLSSRKRGFNSRWEHQQTMVEFPMVVAAESD